MPRPALPALLLCLALPLLTLAAPAPLPRPPRALTTLRGHTNAITRLAFSPQGALASASKDNTIKLWDLESGKARATLKGHTDDIVLLDFDEDGKVMSSFSLDGKWRKWDVRTGEMIFRFPWPGLCGMSAKGVVCSAGHGERQIYAAGKDDGTIELFDIERGKELATFKAHTTEVASLAFSPSGKALASGSADGIVKFWDVKTSRNTAAFKGHAGRVTFMSFSPDGNRLASASADCTIKLWALPVASRLAR